MHKYPLRAVYIFCRAPFATCCMLPALVTLLAPLVVLLVEFLLQLVSSDSDISPPRGLLSCELIRTFGRLTSKIRSAGEQKCPEHIFCILKMPSCDCTTLTGYNYFIERTRSILLSFAWVTAWVVLVAGLASGLPRLRTIDASHLVFGRRRGWVAREMPACEAKSASHDGEENLHSIISIPASPYHLRHPMLFLPVSSFQPRSWEAHRHT